MREEFLSEAELRMIEKIDTNGGILGEFDYVEFVIQKLTCEEIIEISSCYYVSVIDLIDTNILEKEQGNYYLNGLNIVIVDKENMSKVY